MRLFVLMLILKTTICSVATIVSNAGIVNAQGSIYIRADGSVDPSTAPIQRVDNTYIFTSDIFSVEIFVQRSNIIIDGNGYSLAGVGKGTRHGLYLDNIINITITKMKISGTFSGIYLDTCSNVTIGRNNISDSTNGVRVISSSHNSIYENNITSCGSVDGYGGIDILEDSFNNQIYRNNIGTTTAPNFYSINLSNSSNNLFYHNNLISSWGQVYAESSANTWDNGYPSGGNYWNDYAGEDADTDGIGAIAYTISANNKDRYPLMAPIAFFDAGIWNGTPCNAEVVSNSTISSFQISFIEKTLNFDVADGIGFAFSRLTIPNIIVQQLWNNNYAVLVDGQMWNFKNWTDSANTYIYIIYTYQLHYITIIPEFPSLLALPLFFVATFAIVAICRRKPRINRTK